MLAIWKQIGRSAASDAPELITGETGTGRDLVARAIHEYSPFAREPFVAVNLAALPAGLIESELFGHERGAFTGASARRVGRFELAQNGTLFLDEIGDLDALLQTKLLRVLQDGFFERVGGTERVSCRTRVLTATNKPFGLLLSRQRTRAPPRHPSRRGDVRRRDHRHPRSPAHRPPDRRRPPWSASRSKSPSARSNAR